MSVYSLILNGLPVPIILLVPNHPDPELIGLYRWELTSPDTSMNRGLSGTSIDIQGIVGTIYATGKITRANQNELMTLIFSDQVLGLRECQQISEIINRLNNGWLKVID